MVFLNTGMGVIVRDVKPEPKKQKKRSVFRGAAHFVGDMWHEGVSTLKMSFKHL